MPSWQTFYQRGLHEVFLEFVGSTESRPTVQMDLAEFRDYCLGKRDVTEGLPFGPDVLVFKVGGKMFALAALDETPTTVNLKCDPDRALELRDRFEQVRPGYHMNKKHWNTVEIDSGIPGAEVKMMIDHSFDLVLASLPKTRRNRSAARKARGARSRKIPAAKRRARH